MCVGNWTWVVITTGLSLSPVPVLLFVSSFFSNPPPHRLSDLAFIVTLFLESVLLLFFVLFFSPGSSVGLFYFVETGSLVSQQLSLWSCFNLQRVGVTGVCRMIFTEQLSLWKFIYSSVILNFVFGNGLCMCVFMYIYVQVCVKEARRRHWLSSWFPHCSLRQGLSLTRKLEVFCLFDFLLFLARLVPRQAPAILLSLPTISSTGLKVCAVSCLTCYMGARIWTQVLIVV